MEPLAEVGGITAIKTPAMWLPILGVAAGAVVLASVRMGHLVMALRAYVVVVVVVVEQFVVPAAPARLRTAARAARAAMALCL